MKIFCRSTKFRTSNRMRRCAWFALILICVCVPLTWDARAATITVNTTVDELNNNGNCSLREAVRAANLNAAVDACAPGSGADEIVFAAGVTPGVFTLTIPGIDIVGSFDTDDAETGDLDVIEDLSIKGGGAAATVIDGGGIVEQVFHALGPAGVTLSIQDVALTNGVRGVRLGQYFSSGVGSGNLVITDSIIYDNSGIGIHAVLEIPSDSVSITRSTVANSGTEGIGVTGLGTVRIMDSSVLGSGTNGVRMDAATAEIVNTTIALNDTGTLNDTALVGDNIILLNSTVSGNNLGSWGPVTLHNSIYGDNLVDCVPGDISSSVFTSLGYNVIGSAINCNLPLQPSDIVANPGLDAFSDDGTPGNGHFPLLAASPAVDTADDPACPSGDQLGAARGADGDANGTFLCDRGAIELVPADGIAPTTTAVPAPAPNTAGWNNTDVVVTLTATDNIGGSGVREIEYSLSGAQAGGDVVQEATAQVTIASEGITALTYFATDNAGNVEAENTLQVKIDRTAPVVACEAMPARLWPPNHKLVDVDLIVQVTDGLSGSGGFTLISVTSSEPDDDVGDGSSTGDIQGFDVGTADVSGSLRAERSGPKSGRIYTITYEGVDLADNSANCSTTVVVQHNQ